MRVCESCGKETSNPRYCSRSCAARCNNKKSPKRRPEGICKTCAVAIASGDSYCKPCWENHPLNTKFWQSMTLGEKKILNGKHPSWAYASIRGYARNFYHKHYQSPKCLVCSYDKHIEVCHITPISSFEDSILLSVVNSLDNLVGLCPNHHWELDKGILNFDDYLEEHQRNVKRITEGVI